MKIIEFFAICLIVIFSSLSFASDSKFHGSEHGKDSSNRIGELEQERVFF